jgi:hypothetical protein
MFYSIATGTLIYQNISVEYIQTRTFVQEVFIELLEQSSNFIMDDCEISWKGLNFVRLYIGVVGFKNSVIKNYNFSGSFFAIYGNFVYSSIFEINYSEFSNFNFTGPSCAVFDFKGGYGNVNTTISHNNFKNITLQGSNSFGGLIFIHGDSSAIDYSFLNNTVVDVWASAFNGVGIYFGGTFKTLELRENTFDNITTEGDGGGVYVDTHEKEVQISSCNFVNNKV